MQAHSLTKLVAERYCTIAGLKKDDAVIKVFIVNNKVSFFVASGIMVFYRSKLTVELFQANVLVKLIMISPQQVS